MSLQLLRKFSGLFPLKPLIKGTQQNICLPYYHSIEGAQPIAHIKHLYQLRSTEQFERDLDYLMSEFKPISFEVLSKHVLGIEIIDYPAFHITFDDGLKEIFTIARSIMNERNISSSIFLNPCFIDNNDMFYGYKASLIIDKIFDDGVLIDPQVGDLLQCETLEKKEIEAAIRRINFNDQWKLDEVALLLEVDFKAYLSKVEPYLSINEIKVLMSEGHSFGAHGFDHPHFEDIEESEQIRQVVGSLSAVEDAIGVDVKSFSFPFSDANVGRVVFKALDRAYPDAVVFGTQGLKQDDWHNVLHRIWLEGTDLTPEVIVKAEYLKCLANRVRGTSTVHRY